MKSSKKHLEALERKNPALVLKLLLDERSDSFAALPLPNEETEALYVYDVGPLEWQREIIEWLDKKKERKLFLILKKLPPSLSLELLEHPRAKLGETLKHFVWDHLYQPWDIIGGNAEDREELADLILGVELTFSLYRDFGITELSNVIKNLNLGGKRGENLRGKFTGVPAVICGAGPSLEKSIEALRQVEGKALIFGGGSALGPLGRFQIPIHFAVSLDPNPPVERFSRQIYFETPLFYEHQVAHTLLASHHGPRLALGDSGGFSLEQWLTEELGLSTSDVGWNTATFATYIAALLGCNPIYFVGMDLCVYRESSYSVGVEGLDDRINSIELRDRYGNPVTTRPDFLMGKKWLEEFAERHPHIEFYNASEGGLALKGIPYRELNLQRTPFDLQAWVHKEVQEAPCLNFNPEKLVLLDQSIKRVQEILEEFLKGLKEGKHTILQEYELEEELFYQFHLLPMWEVWRHLLQNDRVIAEMKNPNLEKQIQRLLFFKDITEKFCHERNLSV